MSLIAFFRRLFARSTSVTKKAVAALPRPASSAKVLQLTTKNHVLKTMQDVEQLAKKLPGSSVKKNVWYLGGNILSGVKLRGKGDQREDQDPLLRVHIEGLVITNGFCRDVKDGLHIAAENVTLRNMHWLDVGEDAVNNRKGAFKTKVAGCTFNTTKKDNDKTLQLNDGRGAEVVDCTIVGGITGIRLGDKWSDQDDTATVKRVRFQGCDTALNLATIRVKVQDCTYEGVAKRVVHSHGSKLI